MEPVKPTFIRALRLFLAFMLRYLAYMAVGVITGGVVLGVLVVALNLGPDAKQSLVALATYVIGLPALYFAAQHVLSAKIGDFRVMLVKAE